MANFSSLQSKFMRMYESNPQYRMLSVDSAMAQMVQDGVLTKAEYDQLIKTSAFGFGFNSDLGDSVEFGGTTPVENYQHSPSGGIVTSKDKPKLGQLNNVYIETATLPANYQIIPGEYTILTGDSYTAFSYLSDIFEEGKTSFEQQRMNEGWVSDAINAWREWINAKATRSDVFEKLADTRNDVELLNAAMRGALVDGNGNNVDFETAFEATRGVKYSKEKIELCQQKAETYAQADMFHTGLEDLISNLEKFSHGSSDLQYAKEFNKNALKTFQMLGLSDQGKINEALAETSKAVGYEIKLVKQGTKGKDYYGQDFAIMFKNKDGKFVPLTPEISRMISDDLISKIDATKKTLLGLPLDSSDKEVEKHLERLKNEYEQSFREAYGDKDISILSEEYITAQQKGMMAVNIGTNIVLMATSMLTGGVTAGLMTGLLMTQPLQALEMFTDENSETNLEAYGKMMLSQIPWMGAGMVMGKLSDLARSFVKLKGLQSIATKTGQSLDDLVKFMSKGGELKDDVIEVLKRTRIKADVSGISTEMLLDYAVTKLVQPEGATSQDWIMSFVGALAGSSLNKNLSDFTKTKDVRAVELQKAFPDLRLSAEEAGKIISKIDEMVADGSWEQTVAKGADESVGKTEPPRYGAIVLESEIGDGFVVKIGDAEYLAKNMEEVNDILKTNGQDVKNVDFTKIELEEELCAGSQNEHSTFSAIVKNPVMYFKNMSEKKQLLKDIELEGDKFQQAEYVIDQLIKRGVDISLISRYHLECLINSANDSNDYIRNLNTMIDIEAKLSADKSGVMREAIKQFVRNTKKSHRTDNEGIDVEALFSVFRSINENNISNEQFIAMFNRGKEDLKYGHYRDFIYHSTDKMWEDLAKIIPTFKDLPAEQITALDIYKLLQMTNTEMFNRIKVEDKQNILSALENLPENVKQKIQDTGFDVRGIEAKLKITTQTIGYAVKVDKVAQKNFLRSFIVSKPKVNDVTLQALTAQETILGGQKFRTFVDSCSDSGIPLKYSRTDFVKDLNSLLENLSENERADVLKELNITLTGNSFSGFVKLNDFNLDNYAQSSHTVLKQIRECANNFVKNNEVVCSDPEIKAILDDIVKGFPEFTSIMGKVDTENANKLEIHILQALNEAISNPKYKKLTDEEKKILKFSILLNDLGKQEGIGGEHASLSVVFARSILSKFNLNDTMQNSIINLVKYHHFAEGVYGYDFNFMFRTESEQKIAVVMAEADYSARFNKELDTHKYHTKGTKELNYSIFDAVDTFRKPGNRLMTDNNKSVSLIAPRYKYQLQNGETVEIPVMDMRHAKPNEPASNFGWQNGKTLAETASLVHNCSKIENVKTVLESQLDPNMDITLSTRVRRLMDKDSEYGYIQLILNTTDSNIGGVFGTNVGSGGKKGFSDFIYSIFGGQRDKTAKVGLELADLDMNEILVLNPKVEQIAILADITPEQIPIELVELSYKYKVPIIILGKKVKS